jgi:hypothetical protein
VWRDEVALSNIAKPVTRKWLELNKKKQGVNPNNPLVQWQLMQACNSVVGMHSHIQITTFTNSKAMFSFQKFLRFPITSNVWTHAWSIKCRRK